MWISKRKVCKYRVMFRILNRQISAQKKFWIFCGIAELTAVFLNLTANYRQYTVGYGVFPCRADYFVWENGLYAKLFYIVPISLLLFMKSSRGMEGEQLLIRKDTRKAVWYEMIFRTAVVSLVLALFHTVCVLLYTVVNPAENVNWNRKRSVFWLLTEGNVCEQGTVRYVQVVLAFFVLESLTCFLTGILYLLCTVSFKNQVWGWLLCLVMILVEPGSGKAVFFYGRISLDYANWLKPHFTGMTLIGCVEAAAGILLGKYLIERKEYYGR